MTRKRSTKFVRRIAKNTLFTLAKNSTDDLDKRWYLYEKIAFYQNKVKYSEDDIKLIHNVCEYIRKNTSGDPLVAVAGVFYSFFVKIRKYHVNRIKFSDNFGVNPDYLTQKSNRIYRDVYLEKFEIETRRAITHRFSNR